MLDALLGALRLVLDPRRCACRRTRRAQCWTPCWRTSTAGHVTALLPIGGVAQFRDAGHAAIGGADGRGSTIIQYACFILYKLQLA